jgi:hypothetical protein
MNTMSPARSALAVLAALTVTGVAGAQVKEPPRPDKLDLQIRYRIRADRDERIRQFRALEKYLASLGFDDARKNDPDRELEALDPTAERLTGTIPSANVFKVLDDPHVLNILFAPADHKYPDSADKPVAVRIVIRDGLLPKEQQALHAQVLGLLDLLGFQEALGYDTRGYTQIKGVIPYKNLPLLVKDLRAEPSGWFLPIIPPDRLPRPLSDRNPVRWVEVMPVTDPPPPFEAPPLLPAQAKITPDLRAVMLDPALKDTPVRVIAFFAENVEDRVEALRGRLTTAFGQTVRRDKDGKPLVGPNGLPVLTEGAALDGAVGNLASIRFDRPADVDRFAAEPGVISVRLPREGSETIVPLPPTLKADPPEEVLKTSGVSALQRLGYTGTGIKVLVIASDFTGSEKLVGNALPARTRIIDMTAELNPDIRPLPAEPNRVGTGTAAAKAVALASPDAELTLVRIDPGSFFQLFEILRLARGEITYSEAMRSRLTEISIRTAEVNRRKDAAVAEYRAAFADLSDDVGTQNRRDKARAALEAVIAEQTELARRVDRFNLLQKEMTAGLLGARVIVNTLVWESGYPLDAMSGLSQLLERLGAPPPPRVTRRPADLASIPKPPIAWMQAASMAGAAVWGGPFLDVDRNGTMEFAPPGSPLPPGSWSPEMNFLGVRSPTGQTAVELPAGVKLRFTIQWREPRDPNLPGLDIPAVPMVLRIFRQLDPNGEKRPSDELAEDGRSVGGPYPIFRTATFVVYEQMLDFTTPVAGRYALSVATGYQPDPLLPALRREVEIHPRIVIDTLSARPGEGTIVFRSYVTPAAGVGIPADSGGAVTVGVPGTDELSGGGTGITLRTKPDLLGPAAVNLGEPAMRGTGIATAFLGGMATELVQAGAAGVNPFRSSGFEVGKPAVVPEGWLKYLRPAPRPPR